MLGDAKLSSNGEHRRMDLILRIGKTGTKHQQIRAALRPLPCILPLVPPPSGYGAFLFPLIFPYFRLPCRHTIMIDTSVAAETSSRKREREISQEPMTPSVVCRFVYSFPPSAIPCPPIPTLHFIACIFFIHSFSFVPVRVHG